MPKENDDAPFSLELEMRDGYFVAVSQGEIRTLEEYFRKVRAIVDTGLGSAVYRILLDERKLFTHLDAHDIAMVAKLLEEEGVPGYGVRLACLYNPRCLDTHRLCETMYRNRSIIYRLFLDRESAVAWLKG